MCDTNKEVSNNIKAIRTKCGMTQEDVANEIGISRQRYNYWESRPMQITVDKLSTIATVLGCNWQVFFVK